MSTYIKNAPCHSLHPPKYFPCETPIPTFSPLGFHPPPPPLLGVHLSPSCQDIVDTGGTMKKLLKLLEKFQPASVKVAR